MKAKILAATSIVLLILLISAVSAVDADEIVAAETIKLYVDPPEIIDETLVPGTLFNVSIRLANVPASAELVGIQFQLNWNPTLLRATGIFEVVFHEVTPESEWDNIWTLELKYDNTGGHANYAVGWVSSDRAYDNGYAPISGSHTVAVITFNVTAVGECSLTFLSEKTILGDRNAQRIPHDAADGFFSNLPPSQPPLLFHVDPHQTNAGTNSTFYVAVKLDSVANHSGITGVQFDLVWDPTLLDAVNMTEVMFHDVTPVSEWDNIWAVAHRINNTGGSLTYAYTFQDQNRAVNGSYAPIFGNHTLATIEFRVKDAGNCSLHLNRCWAGDPDANLTPSSTIDGIFTNTMVGDLNEDGVVDLRDAILLSSAYGTAPGHPRWNPNADVNGDGVINILDVILLANNFGRRA